MYKKGGTVTTIHYDADGDLTAIAGERVAVVGYGNQGRSWALNLRDSGVDPWVCVRRDASRDEAERDGFEARDIAAAGDADIICVLVPDDVIPSLGLRPRSDACTILASGYTLAFDRLRVAGDVGMVAPRMLGPEVRRCYEEGARSSTATRRRAAGPGRRSPHPVPSARCRHGHRATAAFRSARLRRPTRT